MQIQGEVGFQLENRPTNLVTRKVGGIYILVERQTSQLRIHRKSGYGFRLA